MLGSLPRFSVPAVGSNSLFPLLAHRTRGVDSVTVKKSRSQGVEELRSPGMENRELTATPTLGPPAGRPSATPRPLDLSTARPRNLTNQPGRQGLRKSAKSYERSQYVIENKERHIENEPKTNPTLSVFCADRTQKVRSSVKHVRPGGSVAPGTAEGFRRWPSTGNPQDRERIQKSWERT